MRFSAVLFLLLGFQTSAFAASCPKILNGEEDMTIRQVRKAMYGTDHLHPSEDSWLGQYIAETGAKTTIRRFPMGPDFPRKYGEEKLVVAVSPESFETFQKYFARKEILQHMHDPGQGTLELTFKGKIGNYGRMNHEMYFPAEGSILPTILLSSAEGERAEKFFELGAQNGNLAQYPWNLQGYCKRGGYSSCTHWVANIPLGEKRVERYVFPGRVDEHADEEVTEGAKSGKLHRYRGNYSQLTRDVWKVPGHMQLWEVLDQYKAQVGGYFANPGWVAHVLTAWVKPNRVPVVFVMVADHRARLNKNFDLHIDAY